MASIRRIRSSACFLGLLVAGAGNGILHAALGRQAVASAVPADRSAAQNTARYLGRHRDLQSARSRFSGSATTFSRLYAIWDTAVLVTSGSAMYGVQP